MNGYRKMISDNIPKTWDIALRYCKCRGKWIEYVYTTHVKPFDKDWRSKSTRNRLKASECRIYTGKQKTFSGKYISFEDTIELSRMRLEKDVQQYIYWKQIIKWVEWFSKKLQYIENAMEKRTDSDEDCAEFINKAYHLNSMKLALYIVKTVRHASYSS